jgi:hypothetical protein
MGQKCSRSSLTSCSTKVPKKSNSNVSFASVYAPLAPPTAGGAPPAAGGHYDTVDDDDGKGNKTEGEGGEQHTSEGEEQHQQKVSWWHRINSLISDIGCYGDDDD